MKYVLIFFTLGVLKMQCFPIETFTSMAACNARRGQLTQDMKTHIIAYCAEVSVDTVPQTNHKDLIP